jgi:RimJ/RimL family protein N-acetyltransferase
MLHDNTYLFTSERLGFRNWVTEDIEIMSELNADEKVMEFFPATQTREQTAKFITNMQREFAEKKFCYFAVDTLYNHELIGFIGLFEQTFESDFTPSVDIGWRLKRSAWNKGYATEGAKSVLHYAFNVLNLEKICSFTPVINTPSENVMKKIGLTKAGTFDFPLFKYDDRLKRCVLYEIKNKKDI